jgi:hypothetical protein
MELTIIKAARDIPASKLEPRGQVAEPVGLPVASIRSSSFHNEPDVGIWECSAGKWRRQVTNGEFCYFLAGRCIFHADSGRAIAIEAGDVVFFPPNTTGTWEILETVRKTYVLLAPAA